METPEQMRVIIRHRGETRECCAGDWRGIMDEMVKRLGPWDPLTSSVEIVQDPQDQDQDQAETEAQAAEPRVTVTAPEPRRNSDWGATVHDADNAARIRQMDEDLARQGITLHREGQLYATGTRMADVGYAEQDRRRIAYEAMPKMSEAAGNLIHLIRDERRQDHEITAGELRRGLGINGGLRYAGLQLRAQAVRGLLSRLGSPAARYVFGLRERCGPQGPENWTLEQRKADRDKLLDVLDHELRQAADVPLKLRTRTNPADVYAIVSPSYAVADATEIVPEILANVPGHIKGRAEYAPGSTQWTLQGEAWTPILPGEQVVGEPFSALVTFRSRDNGTSSFRGGGSIIVLACLNASCYAAWDQNTARIHRQGIHEDMPGLVGYSLKAIDTLGRAWAHAIGDVIPCPVGENGEPLPLLGEAIPGLFLSMLSRRRGALVGAVPGRSIEHAQQLAQVYPGERRNRDEITRGDLAQTWTRWSQRLPADQAADAEAAIGDWLVTREPVSYVALR